MRRRIFQDPFEGQTNLFAAPQSGDESANPEISAPATGDVVPAPAPPDYEQAPADQMAVLEDAEELIEEIEEDEDGDWDVELDAHDDAIVAAAANDIPSSASLPKTAAVDSGVEHESARDERWSDLDGLPPLIKSAPRRRLAKNSGPDSDGADEGEPLPSSPRPLRRRPARRPVLRLVMAAALLMVAFAGMAAIVYRFATHDPDYDAILAILNGETKAAAEERQRQAANPVPAFRWPCAGEISSLYGERIHPKNGRRSMHTGIDIAAPYYEMVFAAADGVVTFADRSGGKGNLLIIKHNQIYETQYFHLQKIKAKKGDKVSKGDLVAWVGSTGYSTGPHLHLEIHKRGEPQDPALYLPPPGEDRLVRLKRDGVDYPMGGN